MCLCVLIRVIVGWLRCFLGLILRGGFPFPRVYTHALRNINGDCTLCRTTTRSANNRVRIECFLEFGVNISSTDANMYTEYDADISSSLWLSHPKVLTPRGGPPNGLQTRKPIRHHQNNCVHINMYKSCSHEGAISPAACHRSLSPIPCRH